MPSSRLHPLLPTPTELLLLSTFPIILILGSLFSLLSNPARHAPYSSESQSHPPELAPSYFALKRNILNTYFVKVGWFWVTVGFWIWWASAGNALGGGSQSWGNVVGGKEKKGGEEEEGWKLTPQRLRAALRWALVTGYWFLVTQWFFGPNLIDRTFKLTGGACDRVLGSNDEDYDSHQVVSRSSHSSLKYAGEEVKHALSAGACKAIGGQWKGGYDISGHVFILVLGTAFLGAELLPMVLRTRALPRLLQDDGSVVDLDSSGPSSLSSAIAAGRDDDDNYDNKNTLTTDNSSSGKSRGLGKAIYPPAIVGGLSLWMLLMTAVYFHTWFEKFLGLVVALVGVWVVYVLPRASPGMRGWVGMPGV